jgi:hypothetical protein
MFTVCALLITEWIKMLTTLYKNWIKNNYDFKKVVLVSKARNHLRIYAFAKKYISSILKKKQQVPPEV